VCKVQGEQLLSSGLVHLHRQAAFLQSEAQAWQQELNRSLWFLICSSWII